MSVCRDAIVDEYEDAMNEDAEDEDVVKMPKKMRQGCDVINY